MLSLPYESTCLEKDLYAHCIIPLVHRPISTWSAFSWQVVTQKQLGCNLFGLDYIRVTNWDTPPRFLAAISVRPLSPLPSKSIGRHRNELVDGKVASHAWRNHWSPGQCENACAPKLVGPESHMKNTTSCWFQHVPKCSKTLQKPPKPHQNAQKLWFLGGAS